MSYVRMTHSPAQPSTLELAGSPKSPKRKHLVASTLFLAALLAGCAEGGGASEQDFVPPDGSDVTVVTDGGKNDAAPDVSPDADASAVDAADEKTEDVALDVPADGACATGMKMCNGACVSATLPANGCGGSSCEPCQFANATAKCEAGACAISTCNTGFGDCNNDKADGCEIDIKNDPANCKACGHECVVPQATPNCVEGTCGVATCNDGFANCNSNHPDGCEVNLNTDPSHCSVCDNVCSPVGQSACLAGQCKIIACVGQMDDCDGNPDNGCETNLSTSLAHCGACANGCALPNAVPVCQDKTCRIASCDAGYENCDGDHANGCEIHTTNDASHCGACSTVAAPTACSEDNNSSSTCKDGKCSYTCDDGFADCNGPQPGASDDGCEMPTSSDALNCGGCGVKCVNPHGTSKCVAGLCVPVCADDWGDCNNDASDGCETSLLNTTNACGSCNIACVNPHGTTSCVTGKCVPACTEAGFANCDSNAVNGCETDTQTTANHCGACGSACVSFNGTNACVAGKCVPDCNTGFGDCDSIPKNGCEASTTDDEKNCGKCGTACTFENGMGVCSNSVCTLGCVGLFGDCDKDISTGCETPLSSDINNCGKCDLQCSSVGGAASCLVGVCKIACTSPFKNCNTDVADGCEVNSNTDVNNCGSCGFTCENAHGTTKCEGASCVPSCLDGFKNCDTNPANGCEKDVATDPLNCGECNVKCQVNTGTSANTCSGSACHPTCNSLFQSCDSDAANGCETDLRTTVNCGGCGNLCTAGPNQQASCATGSCTLGCLPTYFDADPKVPGCECQQTNGGTEKCDGIDNDCNGTVDDGFDKLNDPYNCGNTCTKCGNATTAGLCCAGVCRDADASNCGACDQACSTGMLVINEVMANPASTTPKDASIESPWEWFEIYNPGTKNIDIRGFTIKDNQLDLHIVNVDLVAPVIVPAGGYKVLSGGDSATNGASVGYVYSGYSLKNGADEIVIMAFGTEIDRVDYTTLFNTVGFSWELAKNRQDASQNNSMTNWCKASATKVYHTGPAPDLLQDHGTPGFPNDCTK